MATGSIFLGGADRDLVRAGDAAANWWRTQTLSRGLGTRAEVHYETAVEPREPDPRLDAWRELRSVMLMAGLAAHRSDWRRATRMVAQEQVLFGLPGRVHEVLEDSLEMLLAAGDSEGIKTLASRLRNYGPVEPLWDAVATCDLEAATQSSLRAELELVKQAADVLPEDLAVGHLGAATALLRNPKTLTERLHLQFVLPYQLLEVIAALTLSAGPAALEGVARYLQELAPEPDQGLATHLAEVLESIPASSWPTWLWDAMSSRAGDHDALTRAIERCRADLDPAYRDALTPRVGNGDLYAVVAHGNAADLPNDVVKSLMDDVISKVQAIIERAGQGWDEPVIDPIAVLISVNIAHPHHARWDVVCEAVGRGAGSPGCLIHNLQRLSNNAHRMTDTEKAALGRALERLDALPDPWFGTMVDRHEVSVAVAEARAAVDPCTLTPARVMSLAQGSYPQQKAAALALARTRDSARLGSLVALLASHDPRIRGIIAHCLTGWIRDDVAPEAAIEVLDSLLAASGAHLARSVGNLLAELEPSNHADAIAARLTAHPSARARQAAQAYLAGRST